MRLKEFVENKAMDATIAQLGKVFSKERKAADDAVRSAVRAAQMGKGDADVIKSLIDTESAALAKDPDIKISATQHRHAQKSTCKNWQRSRNTNYKTHGQQDTSRRWCRN